MKVMLVDGTEFTVLSVIGEKRNVQGFTRDTLQFVFDASIGLDAIDAAFTNSNCETIKITSNDGSEYVHHSYTIRADLYKKSVEVSVATSDSDAVYEDRITVSMSQRTYVETQLAENTAALNALLTGEAV